MPVFHIVAHDGPEAGARRKAALSDHFAHIERVMDAIRVAGPLKDAQGTPRVSLFIVEARDAAAARAFVEADPYFAAGVWDRIEVEEFLPAAGGWIGGKIW